CAPAWHESERTPTPCAGRAGRWDRRPPDRAPPPSFCWTRPERFRLHNVRWGRGIDLSRTHRFTIDYEEDYRFIAAVYDELYAEDRPFSVEDILALLEARPDIYALNAAHRGAFWHRELTHA